MLTHIPRDVMAMIVDNDPARSKKVCLVCKPLAAHKDAAVLVVLVKCYENLIKETELLIHMQCEDLIKCYENLIGETERLVQNLRDEMHDIRFRLCVQIGTELFNLLRDMRAGHTPSSSRIGVYTDVTQDRAYFDLGELVDRGPINRELAVGHVKLGERGENECLSVDFKFKMGRKMMLERTDRDSDIYEDENELNIYPNTLSSGTITVRGFNAENRRVKRSRRYNTGWFDAVRAVGFIE